MYQNIYIHRTKKGNILHLWDDKLGYITEKYKPYCYVKSDTGEYTTMFGDKCKKISKYHAKDYTQDLLVESDVNLVTRYLVDNYYNDDSVSEGHVVLTYDIEVKVEDGFPHPEEAKTEIRSIAFHDSITGEYSIYCLDAEKLVDVDFLSNEGVNVRIFDNEGNLLSAFLDQVENIQPTIITGWNTDLFDNPFLYNRICNVLGHHEANRLSPIRLVEFKERKNTYKIAGVSSLDYYLLYRKYTFNQEPSYTLDYIANLELGVGKLTYEGSLNQLYDTDRTKFMHYNVIDVKRVVQLDEKLNFIELTRRICHAGRVEYDNFLFSSKYLEGAILSSLKRKNLISTNIKRIKGDSTFEGAYVKEPIAGKYDWVFDLDLTSLYPSIVMSLNISPETKIGKILNWNYVDYMKSLTDSYKVDMVWDNKVHTMSRSELQKLFETTNCAISCNGVLYRTDVKGVIPELLEIWFETRKEYSELSKQYHERGDMEKSAYYDKLQHVQKILLNSMYGVLGLSVFRFYDVDNAVAVTSSGQEIIKRTADMANMYYSEILEDSNSDNVIYIDTDSIFMTALPILEKRMGSVSHLSEDEIALKVFDVAGEVQDYLNEMYDVMAYKMFNIKKHRFTIKKEAVARSGIWTAKKRYAQWIIVNKGKSVDKLDVKGMDTVRSSFPTSFKKLLEDVLVSILKGKDNEYVNGLMKSFKSSLSKVDVSEVAKTTTVSFAKYNKGNRTKNGMFNFIKGTPAHVKATLAYNELIHHFNETDYEEIQESEKIKWVYLKNNPYGIECLAFKETSPPSILDIVKSYVDRDKIFERELLNKITPLYEVMNWNEAYMSDQTNVFF